MKKIILIVIATLSISSCGDFLTPSSPNEYVPKNTEALMEMLVGAAYPTPASNDDLPLFVYHQIWSDELGITTNPEILPKGSDTETFARFKEIFCMNPEVFELADYMPSGNRISHKTYEMYFKKISACNVAFDYIDDVDGTQKNKAQVLAEAHVLRAFYYFNFVNIYGEPYSSFPDAPGVPLKLSSGYNPTYATRDPVKDIYKQIIYDLNKAEENYNILDENDKFRQISFPSLPMVWMLRSRVALYMENWQDAAKYAKMVMDSKYGFSLYNLNTYSPTSTEPCLSYTNVDNVNSEAIFVFGHPSCINNLLILGEIPKGTGSNTSTSAAWSRNIVVAAADLISSYDKDDLREKYYSVLEYDKTNKPNGPIKGCYLAYGKINVNSNHSIIGNGKDFGFSMRLSEAYLNYAEACAKIGGTEESKAIEAIRELRDARYITNSAEAQMPTLSGESLVEYIRNERRKELCFEGHRWFDQRRYGMKAYTRKWYERGVLTHEIKINDKDAAFTLPLTPRVLKNNTNLVQNRIWPVKY